MFGVVADDPCNNRCHLVSVDLSTGCYRTNLASPFICLLKLRRGPTGTPTGSSRLSFSPANTRETKTQSRRGRRLINSSRPAFDTSSILLNWAN